MKTILLSFLLVIALAVSAAAADISGKWSGSFTPESGDGGGAYVILKQSGNSLEGTGGPAANDQWPGLKGSVQGNKVSFQVKSTADGTIYKCELVVDGDHMKGDVTFTNANGESGKAKLDLARVTE